VLDGSVIGNCMQKHRHQEFIRFLNVIEAKIPAGKIVHVILDNYAAHKHPKVIEWLGRHPRFTFTSHRHPPPGSMPSNASSPFSPSAGSREGVFKSIVDLQAAINRFLAEHNVNPKPSSGRKAPREIIAAVKRGHQVLDSIH